jgi:hypothetical protein
MTDKKLEIYGSDDFTERLRKHRLTRGQVFGTDGHEEELREGLREAAKAELLELAVWFTRCPSIYGPGKTTAYLIDPERMARARALVKAWTMADD